MRKLRARDLHCWHCGIDQGLVPHHRRNRQMGGSKLLDGLDNLLLVCSQYNGAMESDPEVAAQARQDGHKLGSWESFARAVFDYADGCWYELDTSGQKRKVDADNQEQPLF